MAHLYDHDLANPNQLDNNGLTLDDANRDHDYYAYQLYMDAGLPMSTTVYTQYDQSESQPWIYADSNTNQSRPRNGVQSNPFGQTPIWNAMHHPTVEGYNVLEGSHTSIPYTGYDPTQSYLHTPAAVPSVHAHMNLQPYNGGDIQSAGQATSSRYLENQLSEGTVKTP
ncbi:Zinc finger C2H2 [Penicillium expansum]|nr:Zinc finger C2H2 [Penicillium expansum]